MIVVHALLWLSSRSSVIIIIIIIIRVRWDGIYPI
jgi:hypothetical protein